MLRTLLQLHFLKDKLKFDYSMQNILVTTEGSYIKTSNVYMLRKDEYNKIRRDAIASTYKKVKGNINKETKKERKSLKSHLTTLLIGWTLTLSQLKTTNKNFQIIRKYVSSAQQRMNL